jgi:hypothetical protein
MRMVDEDGEEDTLRLLPAATPQELASLEAGLPCPLPASVRELLAFTRGFENGPLESVDFAGPPGGFGMEEIFPHALPLAHDGSGNYWIADLHADSTDWAPIYFACHDPPVIAFQSNSLEHFIAEILRLANPPRESDVETVRVHVVMDIWRGNPGTIPVRVASSSDDAVLRSFATSLDDSYMIIDLRTAKIGDGFSWGRYGPRTRLVRHAKQPVFACRTKSRWQRLLGR